MHDTKTFAGGLQVEHHVSESSATVRIGGPLTFPDAGAVSGAIGHIIELVLLDLAELQNVGATGAVIVGGRTRDREPLIRAITELAEGVYDELTLGAEATAATPAQDSQ